MRAFNCRACFSGFSDDGSEFPTHLRGNGWALQTHLTPVAVFLWRMLPCLYREASLSWMIPPLFSIFCALEACIVTMAIVGLVFGFPL